MFKLEADQPPEENPTSDLLETPLMKKKSSKKSRSPQFCSDFCAKVYLISMKLPRETLTDINENLKLFESEYKSAGIIPSTDIQQIPLPPSDIFFALHPLSSKLFVAKSTTEFEFLGKSRKYHTAYSVHPISFLRFKFFLTIDHNHFFKIGFCKDVVAGQDYCFSDKENGICFFSCGQTRESSDSCGKNVCETLPKGIIKLLFSFSFGDNNEKKFTVQQMGVEDDKVYNIPIDMELLPSMFYLAISLKAPTKFSIKVFEV